MTEYFAASDGELRKIFGSSMSKCDVSQRKLQEKTVFYTTVILKVCLLFGTVHDKKRNFVRFLSLGQKSKPFKGAIS